MANVLILLAMPEDVQQHYYTRLRDSFPEHQIDLVDHHSKVGPFIEAAEVLITFGPMLADQADEVLRRAPNLKWIQALGTGVDNLIDVPSLGKQVVVTNIHGIHGPPVSEAALAAMLALSRNLPRIVRNQDQRQWDRWPARLLNGKTVGILGVGAIAEELAPKCKVMGMRVEGISSAKREAPGFDAIHHRDDLVRTVSGLDYLVLLTPYSPETKEIVNGQVLAAMKPSSYLINLARGGVVDESALADALENKRIAGAALDVFATEPLPPEHPFWAMENVIITPHLGGFCDVYADLALPVVEENMRLFAAGKTGEMVNTVRR